MPGSASSLSQRRSIFARLIRARNAATGAERASAEAALLRCRIRLAESVEAATARHASSRAQYAVLARLYPESVPTVMRAVIGRSTLRSWCRRLKKDVRTQRKSVKLLSDTSAALARIATSLSGLQSSFAAREADWRACVQTFNDSSTARREGREDRRYLRFCEMQDAETFREIQEEFSLASHHLYDAVNVSQYLAKAVRTAGEEALLDRVHRRTQSAVGTLLEMNRTSDGEKARAIAGIVAEVQNDSARVEEWRQKLVQFLQFCDEELLALTASAVELTDTIHSTRLALCEQEFGSQDVAALSICEHRLMDMNHTCAEGRCNRGAAWGNSRIAAHIQHAEATCFRTASSTSSGSGALRNASLSSSQAVVA